MSSPAVLTAGVFLLGVWLIICLYSDAKYRKLANWLTLGAYLPALLVLIVSQHTLIGASAAAGMSAWLVALLLTLPAYTFNWLGAGDVKMLSAFGLMTGLQFMLLSYAIAGILAGLVVLYSWLGRHYIPYLNLQFSKLGWQIPPTAIFNGRLLPFGALLAVGGLVMLAVHAAGFMTLASAS